MKNLIPQKDKLIHLYFGCLIYAILAFLSPVFAIITVYIVAAGKELMYDKLMQKGTVELLDFVWTVTIPTLLFVQYLIQ